MSLFDYQEFRRFLHRLGVDPDATAPTEGPVPSEPTGEGTSPLFLLQVSREHDALYRLDLGTVPELRVLVASQQGPLKFDCYLVQPSPSHPLAPLFPMLERYHGSRSFDEQREDLTWNILFAVGESLKRCFWAGWPTSTFPPEITVEKLA